MSIVLKANEKILDWRGNIYGTPDMVVEVLSKSTRKKDITVKKDIYEANGVREYWIIDPYMKVISVYLKTDDELKPKEATAEEKIIAEMKQKLAASVTSKKEA